MKKTIKFLVSVLIILGVILFNNLSVQADTIKVSAPQNVKASVSGVTKA